jgi:hypothetical protein
MGVGNYYNWPDPQVNLPVREASGASPEFLLDQEFDQVDWIGWIPWSSGLDLFQSLQVYKQAFEGFTTVGLAIPGSPLIGQWPNTFLWYQRALPAKHPAYGGPGYIWCKSIKGEGFIPEGKAVDGTARFAEAKVRITFTTRPDFLMNDNDMLGLQISRHWDFLGDIALGRRPWDSTYRTTVADDATLLRYVVMERFYRSRYQTIPSLSGAKWNNLPFGTSPLFIAVAPVFQTTFIIITESELHVTQMQIPIENIPHEAIEYAIGKTNLYQYGIGGSGVFNDGSLQPAFGPFGPGTMLCMAPQISKPYVAPNRRYCVDIKFIFYIFPNGVTSSGQAFGGANWAYRADITNNQNRGWFPFSRNGLVYMQPNTGNIMIQLPGPDVLARSATQGPPPPNDPVASFLYFPPADFNLLHRPRGSLRPNPDGSVKVYASV